MIQEISSPRLYPGGVTAGCYVYTTHKAPKWVIVNVEQAVKEYPNESKEKAIQILAKQIFVFMNEMDNAARIKMDEKHSITAFTGYE